MVDRPALLSEIQNGLPPLSEIPQGLTRFGSSKAATPGKSDTRLVCKTVPAADAFAAADASARAPSVAKEPAATSATAATSGLGSRLNPDRRSSMVEPPCCDHD